MQVILNDDKISLAAAAARTGARRIREAIERRGHAVIAVATGLGQLDMLATLVTLDIPWEKVEAFQLDDFINLDSDHPSSTRSFLKRNFIDKVPNLGAFHAIDGMNPDVGAELQRLNKLLRDKTLDVAFICVGENGHIAFNDPPADMNTTDPYIRVTLNERGRKQQVNEGWFKTLEEVPREGITISVREIMSARSIVATVPGMNKARGIAMCLFDEVSPNSPCAVLRWHKDCDVYIDRQSAALVFADQRSSYLK